MVHLLEMKSYLISICIHTALLARQQYGKCQQFCKQNCRLILLYSIFRSRRGDFKLIWGNTGLSTGRGNTQLRNRIPETFEELRLDADAALAEILADDIFLVFMHSVVVNAHMLKYGKSVVKMVYYDHKYIKVQLWCKY